MIMQIFQVSKLFFVCFLQAARSHTVLSIHPALWPGSVLSAVRLGHGASA